jgi:glutathione S-transferase
MTITLYHCPGSRSSGTLFLLEELGQPYEIKLIDVRAGAGQTPEYLAINPMGKVPAIKDGDDIVWESGAICLYLADKYPAARLAPAIGDPLRAPLLRWLFFGPSIDTVLVEKMFNRTPFPGQSAGYGDFERVIDRVLKNGLAAARPWLLGERFSVADISIGAGIPWGLMNGALPRESPFTDYAARIEARPAYMRGRARDAG